MAEPVLLDARTARTLPWLVTVAFFMQALDGTILNKPSRPPTCASPC